jgi:hypothetical protein
MATYDGGVLDLRTAIRDRCKLADDVGDNEDDAGERHYSGSDGREIGLSRGNRNAKRVSGGFDTRYDQAASDACHRIEERGQPDRHQSPLLSGRARTPRGTGWAPFGYFRRRSCFIFGTFGRRDDRFRLSSILSTFRRPLTYINVRHLAARILHCVSEKALRGAGRYVDQRPW